jgi:tRNA modification GTPase
VTDRPTVARLTTAPARGGIAVIVVTGPGAEAAVAATFRARGSGELPPEGRLALGWVVRAGERIDEAVVGRAGPAMEINIHGGPQAARSVLAALVEHGVEVAAGEGDPALASAAGDDRPALAAEVVAALAEATTPLAAVAVAAQLREGLAALASAEPPPPAAALRDAVAGYELMRRLLTPAEVVLAGPPNAGKSALANALAGRPVSLVSERPGTTRDWVRTLAEADGVPIHLTDTAGLWAAADGVDAEAVRRAWERIAAADVVVCLSSGEVEAGFRPSWRRLTSLPNSLPVASKADAIRPGPEAELAVSAETLAGLPELRRAIRRRLGVSGFDPTAPRAFTVRQRDLLTAAAASLLAGGSGGGREALNRLLGGPADRGGTGPG